MKKAIIAISVIIVLYLVLVMVKNSYYDVGEPIEFNEKAKALAIFPHPDDEILVAPIFAKLCVELEGECTFLATTKGENGNCKLTEGCGDDFGALRAEAIREAAELYDADVIQWDLGDEWDKALEKWSQKEGSYEALVNKFKTAIEDVNPDLIFIHDPRHGVYCHPAHRATSALVLAALKDSELTPTVYLTEGFGVPNAKKSWDTDKQIIIKDKKILHYDATEYLPTEGEEAWEYLISHIYMHRSALDIDLEATRNVADKYKRIYLLNLEDAQANDKRYEIC